MSAVIYNLNSTDKTCILGPRATMLQSFTALNWTDLRLSMMLSITKQSDPNDPTGLVETLGAGEENNQMFIGFKSSDASMPRESNFFGVSTEKATPDSDATNLYAASGTVYQTGRATDDTHAIYASNGTTHQGNNIAFVDCNSPRYQNSVQTAYATLVILQMIRTDPTVNLVNQLNAVISSDTGINVDYGVFQSDTSIANIRAITAAATYTPILGPFSFVTVPNAIFAFWPFVNSRLRIHSYVVEKYS